MLKLWTIYLYREIFKNFIFIFLLFFSFLLIIEIFERLSAFLATNKPFFYFLKFLFWKMIVNIFYVYPYVLVLSFILSLFLLSRSAELIALLTLGFRREEILRKIFILLIGFSILGEILLNLIAPRAFYNAQVTWVSEIEGRKTLHLIFKDEVFFEGENFLLIGRPLEPKGEYLSDLTFVLLNAGRIEMLLWASTGFYVNGTWFLQEAIIQKRDSDFRPESYKAIKYNLPFSPQMLVLTEKPVRFLSVEELYSRYKFLKLANRPLEEIWSEIFNRFLNLLSGLLIGSIPIYAFLRIYRPGRLTYSFFISLLSFLGFVSLFLFIQTLSQSRLFYSILLLVLWLGLVVGKIGRVFSSISSRIDRSFT